MIISFVIVIRTVVIFIFSRSTGNRVSTSSDIDKGRLSNKANTGVETTANDTASDEDSQISYSTTDSPTPTTNLQIDLSQVPNQPNQVKTGSSGKVYILNKHAYRHIITN